MLIPKRTRAQQVFIKFCEAYKNRNLPELLSLFTDNINMWGTGIDEYRIGLKQVEEQLKRDWSQSEKGEIETVLFISTPQDALWAAAICNAKITIDGKEYVFNQLRGTIIIENEKTLKISHMHASFPDYRNAENASFPIA